MNEHAKPPMSGAPLEELPHNIQAEQGLLGAILISQDNAAYHALSAVVSAEHFYDPLHAAIFEAIEVTIRQGRTATPVTLQNQFEGFPPLNSSLTVPQYLARLATAAASTHEVKSYAQTVYDLFARRRILEIADHMKASALSAPIDFPPLQQIDEAEALLDALRLRERNEREIVHIAEAMDEAVNQANAAHVSGQGLAGLSTGFKALDDALGGLAPSDLIILGGRPSMGKTALATTIAANVAKSGAGVMFFSLEMSGAQLGQRLLAAETGIAASAQRRGDFGGEPGMHRLLATVKQYGSYPLFVDDTGGMTMPQLAVRARRIARSKGIGLVVLDYLQLMNGSQYRNTNRVQELTEITTGLKALAKELNVPVVVLSQLNRNLEAREDKRPQLSDLRESGSIEQDADVVLFCYRAQYYLERTTPKEGKIAEWEAELSEAAGKAEVIIAKHRHARAATVELGFDGPRTLFTDRV